MLRGFECDEDHTGWLAGIAVWATGAAAACLLAVSTVEPALMHWQILSLAVAVSLISLGLRSPVMLANCPDRVWLVHAVWILGVFAQINWAGFLAARSSTGMIAAEAILICLGLEAWLLILFVSREQLPWLQKIFSGNAIVEGTKSYRESEAPAEEVPNPTLTLAMPTLVESPNENHAEESADIRREFVDGIDENGQRYLSGSVRLQFEPQQRTEAFVLSFCPALDGTANVELECDSENVTAKVEHATETGARITVRRLKTCEAATVTVDWFATASATSPHTMNLP